MNLRVGGLDGPDARDDTRLQEAIEYLKAPEADLDALILQEAVWGNIPDRTRRCGAVAAALGMEGRVTTVHGAASQRFALATFWRPEVFALKEMQQHGAPYWHPRLRVKLQAVEAPDAGTLYLGNRHGSPFSRTERLESAVAEVRLYNMAPSLVGGDDNNIAPGDAELAWHAHGGWQNWLPPLSQEREYQALTNADGDFVVDETGSLLADRRPAKVWLRNGMVDLGASYGDRRPTAGQDGTLTGPRRIDRMWASDVLMEAGVVLDFGHIDDLQPGSRTASRFTDHAPLFTDLNLAALPPAAKR